MTDCMPVWHTPHRLNIVSPAHVPSVSFFPLPSCGNSNLHHSRMGAKINTPALGQNSSPAAWLKTRPMFIGTLALHQTHNTAGLHWVGWWVPAWHCWQQCLSPNVGKEPGTSWPRRQHQSLSGILLQVRLPLLGFRDENCSHYFAATRLNHVPG